MESTIKSIIKCWNLPLSIIIIGIGNANFDNMVTLDGDDGLYDNEGNMAKRDLVQFVPFNKFCDNEELLS